MATKAKPSKKKKSPAAKKPVRKSAAKPNLELLARQMKGLSSRIRALEAKVPAAGPAGAKGDRGPAGPLGPKGDPADPARLEELEQRIAELERRPAAVVQT